MSEPVLGGFHIIRPAPVIMEGRGVGAKPLGLRLMSDLHIGAANTDYKLITRERDDAIEHQDRILINGDLFDLILPKDHKRYTPEAVHPRIQGTSMQVNAVVDWAVELLSPAAHLIDMLGVGNHETAVMKYHAVDPVMMVMYKLEEHARKTVPNHFINYGGYTGFVDYRLRCTTGGRSGGECGSRLVIYYHHGSGGAAPVTKGLIDFNRRDTFIDSDIIWMGHKHNRLTVAVEKLSCPEIGDGLKIKEVRHIMTGAYFNTYVNQTQASIREHGRRSNYAADAGFAPQGKGGARVLVRVVGKKKTMSMQVIQ